MWKELLFFRLNRHYVIKSVIEVDTMAQRYLTGYPKICFLSFRYFDCIDICKVRAGWHEVRLAGILPPMSSTRHLTCLLLTATQPTEVDFTLFQEGQRYSPNIINQMIHTVQQYNKKIFKSVLYLHFEFTNRHTQSLQLLYFKFITSARD